MVSTGCGNMLLRIDTRETGGVTVLDLGGGLLFGPAHQSLAQCVRGLLAQGRTRLVINLSQVSCVDSCGIGELIASFTTARKSGGDLKLAAPGERVREVLQIVRLPAIIEVHDDEAAAVASFG